MSNTTAVRRTASALAASALVALVLAAPAAARPDPGTGGRTFDPTGTVVVPPRPDVVVIDDDAVELLQVGAGLVAGLALAGAGAAMVSRRNHRDPTPA